MYYGPDVNQPPLLPIQERKFPKSVNSEHNGELVNYMVNPSEKINRLLSLDVFRGLTIVGMILVNSPGNNTAYAWLKHATWNGCTLADLVFPFFLFIVGVSIAISFSQSKIRTPLNELIVKIIRRSLIIWLIGLLLNGFPHYDLATWRIYGVLQRIALCYLFASILFLTTRTRTQLFIFISLLIGYYLAMILIPVPGFGSANLSPNGNLAACIDRLLLNGHLYGKTYDPEGILSTLPAIATTLLGNLTGIWLLSKYTPMAKFWGMICAGIIAAIIGWIWGLWFPLNKNLWSSSFVLWTGGLGLILYALCYGLIEIRNLRRWSKPLEIFGINAIAAYVLHIMFLKLQNLIHISQQGSSVNLRIYITEHLFGWASLHNASLFYAISYVLFWLFILAILYRYKIFLKI